MFMILLSWWLSGLNRFKTWISLAWHIWSQYTLNVHLEQSYLVKFKKGDIFWDTRHVLGTFMKFAEKCPWHPGWRLKPQQKLPHNCCLTVNYEQCHVFCLYLIYWTSATATAILLPNNCDIIYTLNWTNFIWYDQCKIANKLLANRPINLLLLA